MLFCNSLNCTEWMTFRYTHTLDESLFSCDKCGTPSNYSITSIDYWKWKRTIENISCGVDIASVAMSEMYIHFRVINAVTSLAIDWVLTEYCLAVSCFNWLMFTRGLGHVLYRLWSLLLVLFIWIVMVLSVCSSSASPTGCYMHHECLFTESLCYSFLKLMPW